MGGLLAVAQCPRKLVTPILPRPHSLPIIVVLLSLPAMTLAQNPVVGGGELQILTPDGEPAGSRAVTAQSVFNRS